MKTSTRTALLFTVLSTLFLATHSGRAETVIWSENFDDGNGDSRWSAETGVWQMGSPTIGPGSAHSTNYCATTGLTANYPVGANSRLIRIQSFKVPAANQSPRLRFWNWYNFACNCCGCDYGVVEIKGTNGTWQAVSPGYSGYGGGWTYASVDLSAYAGQTVQLAFHMIYQQNTSYTTYGAPGWYVDDIALITGTPVFNNPEGWEGGMGDWYAETGTWQVGVPSSGPGTAHAGTNCAATILNGNYPGGANSRLVSPTFVVPAASQYPRLRFWNWYNFACNCCGCDYGVVEIKGTNGTWQAVSPGYSGYGGGWTYASVDLSAYAGQTVQLAFHMIYQQNTSYTTYGAPGWYVDDIALITGTPVLNNPEGWESGMGDWYAETGTWQVGVPSSGPGTAHAGTNCAATILNGNYPGGVNSRFVSPSFVVPPRSTNPYLRFWQWYSFACNCCGCDYGVVEIKAGTNAWTELSPHYTGNSGSWTSPFFDLSAYSGQKVRLAFHMVYGQNTSYTQNGAPGWYIDDIRLVHDFAALLLDSPIVRTQNTACLSIGIADSSPASNVSFTVQAPCGNLTNVTLNTVGCWSGTITPQPNCQWLVSLHNNCPTTAMGVQTVGSICYTAVSTQSTFVPFSVSNLGVTNQDASVPSPVYPFGTRSVIIADQSLLEAWLAANKQRMFTLYGKADTNYVVRYTTNVNTPSPWTPGWTNTMPASLFYSQPLLGTLSNAPVLFLRANEK